MELVFYCLAAFKSRNSAAQDIILNLYSNSSRGLFQWEESSVLLQYNPTIGKVQERMTEPIMVGAMCINPTIGKMQVECKTEDDKNTQCINPTIGKVQEQ